MVGTRASAASCFIDATIASGVVRALFRSRITSDGFDARISASAASADRANATPTPSWFAAVRIFDVNIRSSRTAKIIATMIIHVETAGPFMENAFIVACEATREAVLIDPGDGVDAQLALASRDGLSIKYILLTHAHVDHVTGVAAAKRALGVPVYLHRDDLFLYEHATQHGALFGLRVEAPPPPDAFYTPGQVIAFGELEARPHHTPGHCPGGVCLEIGARGERGKDLFVGDTLFAGSIGRTDLPGGDYGVLMASIRTVLFSFGDDARVHSGHGPSTTIGQERRTNPFLVAMERT
jgi:hydroxyacylglutathione hydrolase